MCIDDIESIEVESNSLSTIGFRQWFSVQSEV